MVLVDYGSSDEDEAIAQASKVQARPELEIHNERSSSPNEGVDHFFLPVLDVKAAAAAHTWPSYSESPNEASPAIAATSQAPSLGPIIGPALGLSLPCDLDPGSLPYLLPEPSPTQTHPATDNAPSRSSSPYTATRTLIRDLTLSAHPNLFIPPSPPGSPTQAQLSLHGKVDTFLALKREKAVHFNERLGNAAALRNPALMDKLLGFVGVETGVGNGHEWKEQYATILPEKLGWYTGIFPEEVDRVSLRRAQERMQRETERAKGEKVEFMAGVMLEGTRETENRTKTFDA